VDARKAGKVVMASWLLDDIACSAIARVAEPFVAVEALEELTRLLIETRAMDAPCAPAEKPGDESPSSPSRPDEPDPSAQIHSSVVESSRSMARGGRRSSNADADRTRSGASRRGRKGVAR
jgi:hypothetical protein